MKVWVSEREDERILKEVVGRVVDREGKKEVRDRAEEVEGSDATR